MKKKFLKGIALIMLIGSAFMLGKETSVKKEKVNVTNILYKSTDNFYLEDGEIGIEFSDGSWASVNKDKNNYVFQPVALEDWNYSFNNLEDFKKCINTYIENK